MIILDTETTGLNQSCDEILQLSIIDDNSTILFNEYFKPKSKENWTDAERIHKISPSDVKDCKEIDSYRHDLQSIFNEADTIIGYNINFDLGFIKNAGFKINKDANIIDVMEVFSPIYGEWNDYFQSYTWQKLTVCADYYGYKWEEAAHNALADCKATLFCYQMLKYNI